MENKVYAHMWANLGNSNGSKKGSKGAVRDSFIKRCHTCHPPLRHILEATPKNHSLLLASATAHTFWVGR